MERAPGGVMQQHDEAAHHVRTLMVKCPHCNAESVCSIDVALWRPGPRPQLIVQQPGVQQPVEQQPFVQQQPVVQQPLAQQLQAQQQQPIVQQQVVQQPVVQQAQAPQQEPVVQHPVVQQPVVQQPDVQQPQAQQLQAQQHQLIAQQPGVQQPVVKQPQTQLQQQQQQPRQLPQSEMDAQLLLVDFHRLLDEGREHDGRGDLEKALDCFKRGTAIGISALQSWPRTAPVVQQHREEMVWAMTRSELILKALARLGRGTAAGKAPPSPQPPPVNPPPQPPATSAAAAAEHKQLRQAGMPRPPLEPPPQRLLALAKSNVSSQAQATASKSMPWLKADCKAEAEEAPPKSMPRRRAHQTAVKEEGSPDGDQKRADSPSPKMQRQSQRATSSSSLMRLQPVPLPLLQDLQGKEEQDQVAAKEEGPDPEASDRAGGHRSRSRSSR